jgi:hypothetical protein
MPCGAQLEVVQARVQREDDVEISDHADLEIRVLPILPRERIDQLVRDELERRGWTRGDDGTLTKQIGDTLATLPPGASSIRITISDETSVQVEANVRQSITAGDEEARAAVNARAEAEAARRLADATADARRALEADAADRLLTVWRELRAELDDVVNVTTRRALEQRATELGAIESIEEGRNKDGGYELTITVRT